MAPYHRAPACLAVSREGWRILSLPSVARIGHPLASLLPHALASSLHSRGSLLASQAQRLLGRLQGTGSRAVGDVRGLWQASARLFKVSPVCEYYLRSAHWTHRMLTGYAGHLAGGRGLLPHTLLWNSKNQCSPWQGVELACLHVFLGGLRGGSRRLLHALHHSTRARLLRMQRPGRSIGHAGQPQWCTHACSCKKRQNCTSQSPPGAPPARAGAPPPPYSRGPVEGKKK